MTMTYHSQRPQCPSLSPHVLLIKSICCEKNWILNIFVLDVVDPLRMQLILVFQRVTGIADLYKLCMEIFI